MLTLSILIILGLSKDFVELLSADWFASDGVNCVHFVFVPTSLKTASVAADEKDDAVDFVFVTELHVCADCRMNVSVTKCPGLANVVKKTISE